jgi:hypothetical protein
LYKVKKPEGIYGEHVDKLERWFAHETSFYVRLSNDGSGPYKEFGEDRAFAQHASKDNPLQRAILLHQRWNGRQEYVIHLAAMYRREKVVDWLCRKCGEYAPEVNLLALLDAEGRTVLHIAAETGKSKLVKYLLDRPNISIDVKDNHGRSRLFYAAFSDKLRVVLCLLEAGAISGGESSLSYSGWQLSWAAVSNSHIDIILRRENAHQSGLH